MYVINITTYCNKTPLCPYCLNWDLVRERKREEMSIEDIKSILRDYRIQKGDVVGLSGGEPTTHSRINEILNYLAREEDVKVIVSTNLEEYNTSITHIEGVYWQLSLHLSTSSKIEKKIENVGRYIKEGHNINCILIPVHHGNFDVDSLTNISFKIFELSPIVPLIFRYVEDTPHFKNKLKKSDLIELVYEKIKLNYHPCAEVVLHIDDNYTIRGSARL